jgi:hypothetical protein
LADAFFLAGDLAAAFLVGAALPPPGELLAPLAPFFAEPTAAAAVFFFFVLDADAAAGFERFAATTGVVVRGAFAFARAFVSAWFFNVARDIPSSSSSLLRSLDSAKSTARSAKKNKSRKSLGDGLRQCGAGVLTGTSIQRNAGPLPVGHTNDVLSSDGLLCDFLQVARKTRGKTARASQAVL